MFSSLNDEATQLIPFTSERVAGRELRFMPRIEPLMPTFLQRRTGERAPTSIISLLNCGWFSNGFTCPEDRALLANLKQ